MQYVPALMLQRQSRGQIAWSMQYQLPGLQPSQPGMPCGDDAAVSNRTHDALARVCVCAVQAPQPALVLCAHCGGARVNPQRANDAAPCVSAVATPSTCKDAVLSTAVPMQRSAGVRIMSTPYAQIAGGDGCNKAGHRRGLSLLGSWQGSLLDILPPL